MSETPRTVPVAIIGLGAIMPDANDVTEFWQNICAGKNCIREVPPERWRIEDHFDADPRTADRTYSKIGAFVTGFSFDSSKYRIPPRVALAMDNVQKWTVAASQQALSDAGYDRRDFDRGRTAVVIGNTLGGELQFQTNLRIYLPRYARALRETEFFGLQSAAEQRMLLEQFNRAASQDLPAVTEDSMPGELSNVIAGRVASVFDLHGPNYTADAACASSLAALDNSINGLAERHFDMVITGGVDSSMSPHSFVKFSKIGALSADRSCPFDSRANGFVMGEGCGILLLKRLADAERDGDKIYAVINGMGSASDGKGKCITAPNPAGQRLALERAYRQSELDPAQITLLEAHGTSTAVGDVVEGTLACELFRNGSPTHRVAMGSIKSQIGHLKSASGAAALIKAALSVQQGIIPGSLNFELPNPQIPFTQSQIFVPTATQPWELKPGKIRRAAVSSFGFGGTNFHTIISEYRPSEDRPKAFFVPGNGDRPGAGLPQPVLASAAPRRFLCAGGESPQALGKALAERLASSAAADAEPPDTAGIAGERFRLAFNFGSAEERSRKGKMAAMAMAQGSEVAMRAMGAQGIFFGQGDRLKVAFLFPGQGSQSIGMLGALRDSEPVVRETFAEADRFMLPILGRPLTSFVYGADTLESQEALKDTNVCQPAMLAADVALSRLLAQHGVCPDMAVGHSLGEYSALVVSGMLSFEEALRAVSARAREMTGVQVPDPGKMAAVMAPYEQIQEILRGLDGVAPANLNSRAQTVLGGTSAAMDEALRRLEAQGIRAVPLQVSHAFHSFVVAPAVAPFRQLLGKLDFRPPRIPVVANVDGRLYETDPRSMKANLDRLARQVAEPVRFIDCIHTLYNQGARLFLEVGPRKVLSNFVLDILDDPRVITTCTNHPKQGEEASWKGALAACLAAGIPWARKEPPDTGELTQAFEPARGSRPEEKKGFLRPEAAIVISGASMGLPGVDHPVFDEGNEERLLSGQSGIDRIPAQDRERLAAQRIVRLVKDAPGGPAFEVVERSDQVAQLAGRRGALDLTAEFGLEPERVSALDITAKLAIAAGLLALRDAGIPLSLQQRATRSGRKLPTGYRLPAALADETGVILASAFPGYDELVQEMDRRHRVDEIDARIAELQAVSDAVGPLHAVQKRLAELKAGRGESYHMDRKFIFRALSMGHAQLAELIGARGPNTQINSACASTTQALAMACDWIQAGRCRRVLVVGADDITNPNLSPWLVGAMFATGAVTAEPELSRAALPFDRRRNGMIPGMGAVGLVVEAESEVSKRGMTALVRILGTIFENSAFHPTRLDPEHIAKVMERLVADAEQRHGLDRRQLASRMVFVSHETYTPARGGSASAEAHALRQTFGSDMQRIVIANTKGLTGHPMGVGIEDVAAVRILEKQIVPPIPNFKEPDPELGELQLSRGGRYDVRYALRLAAGFGSQIALTLTERIDGPADRMAEPVVRRAWLCQTYGLADPALEVENRTLRVVEAEPTPMAAAVASVEPAPRGAPVSTTVPAVEKPASADPALIQERILALVSKKTGYPKEMLEPDLQLEADLGIDTVKQAEMFSEIRAFFGIPKQDGVKLSDYPTLGHLVAFVGEWIEQSAVPPAASPRASTQLPSPSPASQSAPAAQDPDRVRFLAPILVGRPALHECLPTGVSLSGSVLVVGDPRGIGQALAEVLKAWGSHAVVIPDCRPEEIAAEVRRHLDPSTLRGVFVLTPLDDQDLVLGADRQTWERALDRRVRVPFQVARECAALLADRPECFFLCATRMGGALGLTGPGCADPAAGATSGFVKALAREWRKTLCKVVDFERGASGVLIANTLLREVERDRAVVEVGHNPQGRFGIGLAEEVVVAVESLRRDPVVLVTGGMGEIVGPIAQDLADHVGGSFYLLARDRAPDEADPDLFLLRRDRQAFKLELIERLRRAGERVTPVNVELALARAERKALALETVRQIRAAGATAEFLHVDVTDEVALGEAVRQIAVRHGRIDLILHAAGCEQSQSLAQKSQAAFDAVLAPKALGLHALWKAIRGVEVDNFVLFGSVAGRFGNAGQTDYAAANDLLAKFTSFAAQDRPDVRMLCLSFGGWAGRGMGARGASATQLERLGITPIPLTRGAQTVRQALEGGLRGEHVVAAGLGTLLDDLRAEGADLSIFRRRLSAEPSRYPMLGEILGFDLADGLRVQVEFDPGKDLYLNDHRIEGTPVLPGVMAVETFAEAAALLYPRLCVVSIEELAFEAPLKLYRDEPRTATVRLLPTLEGDRSVLLASMETSRELAHGRTQVVRHFHARLQLSPHPQPTHSSPPSGNGNGNGKPHQIDQSSIYRAFFHGPSFKVLERITAEKDGALLGWMNPGTEALKTNRPGEFATRPMLTELAFQAAGILEAKTSHRLALPSSVKRLTFHQNPEGPRGKIAARVTARPGGAPGSYQVEVVDERGVVLLRLDGYRTSAMPHELPSDVLQGLVL